MQRRGAAGSSRIASDPSWREVASSGEKKRGEARRRIVSTNQPEPAAGIGRIPAPLVVGLVPALVAVQARVAVIDPAVGTHAEVRQSAVGIVGMKV